MKDGLTARERETLRVIWRHLAERLCPPTQRELAAEAGVSPATARRAVLGLALKGYLAAGGRELRPVGAAVVTASTPAGARLSRALQGGETCRP